MENRAWLPYYSQILNYIEIDSAFYNIPSEFFEGDFRYAVEVRHASWFGDLAYNFFKNNNIAMVWSQMDRLQTPPIVTSDFVYLRLIGDRRLPDNQSGKIQIDRTEEISNWG